MTLDEMPVPDSHAVAAAAMVARQYCSTALYHHAARSYVWAAAFGRMDGIDFDAELLYVAAMLHDLGLTPPFDSHLLPFEAAGGHVAWVFGVSAGWSPDRCRRASEIVERHMWPSVDPVADPEGHLLEVGTGVDISGSRAGRLPTRLRDEALGRWPRGGLTEDFTECFRQQAERKPESRACAAVEAGIGELLKRHPFEDCS